jgi:3-oxoacyl-[acyl-carrier-protein] synthase III
VIASVEIAGLACKTPERVVTNFDLEKIVDTNDDWITKRTCIKTRHIATKERCVDMAAEVAEKAIESAHIDKKDIGLIISSTITSEYVTPSMSSYVQKALDIECATMDVSAGCSGFIYSLSTAASLMDTLNLEAALVISSETLSTYTDWTDRSTCVLFGDGAGAVVLKKSDKACLHYPILWGSPDKEDVIVCNRELRKTPFNDIDSNDIKAEYIRMKGREVFTYAVGAAGDILHKLLGMCGNKPFTKIIPHQANGKIIDYIKRKLHFKEEQFFLDVDEFANTSSATIPIAMCDAYSKGWLKKGDRLALVAFGSGLTCGGIVVDWTL